MTKPDKYDEKALNVVCGFDFEDSIQDMAEDVAAFGRKCAADAYEDAARIVGEEDCGKTKGQLVPELYAKAAALRGAP